MRRKSITETELRDALRLTIDCWQEEISDTLRENADHMRQIMSEKSVTVFEVESLNTDSIVIKMRSGTQFKLQITRV